jgi:alpha-L-fucosidase 2
MLVQSRPGELHLLPALPEAWRSGSLRGVRVRGGMLLDLDWRDGRPELVTLRAARDTNSTLRFGAKTFPFTMKAGYVSTLSGMELWR